MTEELELTLPSARLPVKVVNLQKGTIAYGDQRHDLKKGLEARGVELWAVRHGQSEVNALEKVGGTSLMCGQLETPLSPLGKQQAVDAAKSLVQQLGGEGWLRDVAADPTKAPVLYSSPFSRARDTAQAFVDVVAVQAHELGLNVELPVHTDDRLKEISFGRFEGKPVTDVAREQPQFGTGKNFLHRFPQGESGTDVLERVGSFLDEVKDRNPDRKVMIYCHLMPVALSQILLGDGFVNPDGVVQVKRGDFPNAVPQQLTRPPDKGELGYLVAGS